jgi:hypothetical protein
LCISPPSVPPGDARYIHSTNAVFDIRDYYSARQLLEQVILNLNIEQINIYLAQTPITAVGIPILALCISPPSVPPGDM